MSKLAMIQGLIAGLGGSIDLGKPKEYKYTGQWKAYEKGAHKDPEAKSQETRQSRRRKEREGK